MLVSYRPLALRTQAPLGAPRLRAPDAWNHAKIKSRKRSVLAAGIEIDGPSLDARPFAGACGRAGTHPWRAATAKAAALAATG